MKEVYDYLKGLDIPYKVVTHERATTTEEADKFIEGIPGIRTKTMFIYNEKKTRFYLVILDEDKRLDFKALAELLGEKKLKFASPDKLQEKLGLEIGMVSLFGLLNNKEHDIKVLIDEEMNNGLDITFHPNINTATVFITYEDMIKFIESLDYEYLVVNL